MKSHADLVAEVQAVKREWRAMRDRLASLEMELKVTDFKPKPKPPGPTLESEFMKRVPAEKSCNLMLEAERRRLATELVRAHNQIAQLREELRKARPESEGFHPPPGKLTPQS